MDPVLGLVVVVVVGVAIVWWLLRRNRPAPVEDEWTLPPPQEERPAPPVDLGPQRLDRDALVNRNRAFDPSRWDNTPDTGAGPGATAEDDDLPRFFDRDYLAARNAAAEPEPDPDADDDAPGSKPQK